MANTINVNQNNNTITLNDQNRSISITDNKTNNTVNVSQPVTRVVTVSTVGIRGPQGPQGTQGAEGKKGEGITSSLQWDNIQGAPNVVDFTGDIVPNQLAIFADTFTDALPINLPFSLPLEPEGDGVPTIKGLSGLTYDGSIFKVEGAISASSFTGSLFGNATSATIATSAITASSATMVDINNVSNDTTFGLIFRDGNYDGPQLIYADSQADTPAWNPNSNLLFSPKLRGTTVSGSIVYANDLRLDYHSLPTSDPGVTGRVWRSGSDLKISAG